MGTLTETTSTLTEFAGKNKVVIVEVDGATGTNTVTVDEFSVVLGAVGGLKEAPTADCCGVRVGVDATTTNQLNVEFIEGDGTACTQNATDAYIIAIGY